MFNVKCNVENKGIQFNSPLIEARKYKVLQKSADDIVDRIKKMQVIAIAEKKDKIIDELDILAKSTMEAVQKNEIDIGFKDVDGRIESVGSKLIKNNDLDVNQVYLCDLDKDKFIVVNMRKLCINVAGYLNDMLTSKLTEYRKGMSAVYHKKCNDDDILLETIIEVSREIIINIDRVENNLSDKDKANIKLMYISPSELVFSFSKNNSTIDDIMDGIKVELNNKEFDIKDIRIL